MIRIFSSPERYIQGKGAFDRIEEFLRGHTNCPLFVVDELLLSHLGPRLHAQFVSTEIVVEAFSGEVTLAAIERLAAVGKARSCDLVVGVGGGKALDAAKGVTRRLGTRFVSVPTIASNDSPTATALAIYDENHRLVTLERIDRNPLAVIVDTALIAAAPFRFLLSGIGDAIAKKFEAERALRVGGVNYHGTPALKTALVIANGCYETLRRYGADAIAAAKRQEADEALEAVVEANLLMAGIGWESGGLSIAHGVVRGVSQARIAENLHGLHVAYGLLVQLAFEERSDAFLTDLVGFYHELGLPVSLADLGMQEASDEELRAIAERSLIGPKGGMIIMPSSPKPLWIALRRIEALATA